MEGLEIPDEVLKRFLRPKVNDLDSSRRLKVKGSRTVTVVVEGSDRWRRQRTNYNNNNRLSTRLLLPPICLERK